MKRILCFLLSAVLAVLLCACNYANKVAGVWEGIGNMSKVSVMAPADAMKTLTFGRDEHLTVVTTLPDGSTRVHEYRWYVTDDTMTFGRVDGNGGFGVGYRLKDGTLLIGDGDGGYNTFYRVD